jgi:chemotaxis protein methyltransferase CheR
VTRADCASFLQWALPRLGMRWAGFRRVRSQVCKRIGRRMVGLELGSLDGYRRYLEAYPEEWARLDAMCRITISRFFRNHTVFEAIGGEVLPALAAAASERGDPTVRVWSCGCASGEEAFSVAMLWAARIAARTPPVEIEITATDADPAMLDRARRGFYGAGSIRELPDDLRAVGLDTDGQGYRVRASIRGRLRWLCEDVRLGVPMGPFDLVLCRNLVLTYFADGLQRDVMGRVVETIRGGGALVIGSHEQLPDLLVPLERWVAKLPIYRRAG